MLTPLEKDAQEYAKHARDFSPSQVGQFVLIFDGRLINVYPSYDAAVDEGYERFKEARFFVKQIDPTDEDRHDIHLGA